MKTIGDSSIMEDYKIIQEVQAHKGLRTKKATWTPWQGAAESICSSSRFNHVVLITLALERNPSVSIYLSIHLYFMSLNMPVYLGKKSYGLSTPSIEQSIT